ncbi:Mlp family lipoprotein, partial [Borrelia coriaceae]
IFIKLLVLCSTLFLYCCNEDTINGTSAKVMPPPHKLPRRELDNLQIKPPEQNEPKPDTLTADEKQKFDVLVNAFNKMIELKLFSDDALQKSQNFLNWLLSTDIPKQKELTNAFTLAYDFLKDKTSLQSNNLTITQFINNALTCNDIFECNPYEIPGRIQIFLSTLLRDTINASNTNEERFQSLKTALLAPSNHVSDLLEEERYERFIEIQLKNDNNRTQALNFLINVLPQDFLLHDMNIDIRPSILKEFFKLDDNGTIKSINDAKLKSILDHINTELNKCNGNETGKNNFRSRIKDYFLKAYQDNTLGATALNNFATAVLSDCQK